MTVAQPAEVRAPVHDAKLAKLPPAFTCFGQQCQLSTASLPKPTLTTTGLRHKLRRPKHHQQSALNRPQAQAEAGKHPNRPSLEEQLPDEAQQACEGAVENITLEELHSALKASARGKRPGSDGLPCESFQTQPAPSLPAFMTQGVITLLYNCKGFR